ncbi:hypothetical protein GUITHDRAFT_163259 [Guillardia theta CCMP2712]|uniref:protein O-GlcNAc transferase n=1 Tax=Guillardia theta (strain CCMP2712) TaxID=905079 RepID=L1JAP4_GUITC|nr:hypothetical protein GUITHDRAFT_163259 [Guillardia theta CCMP2712]EKX45372.1 hypothetical protein GUITHDRAFT_163259 [Guillardia theta CCMP2712]|eukprot:XP_005832352.1 hypothetical protein GUITHDRAFT_163259 [Guillardia theta CCMP2712]
MATRAVVMAAVVMLVVAGEDDCPRGRALRDNGRLNEAVQAYYDCVVQDPRSVSSRHNLGIAYHYQGRQDLAQDQLKSALKLDPTIYVSYIALGQTYKAQGKCEENVECMSEALRIAGTSSASHQIRDMLIDSYFDCSSLFVQGSDIRHTSLNDMARILFAGPSALLTRQEVWNRLGGLLLGIGECEGAIRCFKVAWRLGARNDDPFFGAAICSNKQGMHDQAARLFYLASRMKTSRRPLCLLGSFVNAARMARWELLLSHAEALASYMSKQYISRILPSHLCETTMARKDVDSLLFSCCDFSGVGVGSLLQPHEYLLLNPQLCDFLTASIIYSRGQTGHLKSDRLLEEVHEGRRRAKQGKRLVLGYFSSDFAAHATSHLLKGSFPLHDKGKVSLRCLNLGHSNASEFWQVEISRDCNMTHVDPLMPVDLAVQQIRRLNIDVLLNLNGWTAGHRSDVLSYKVAPVQATYLGYPGTMGAKYMDFFITDIVATTPEISLSFSEKLVVLPGCYYINDHRRYHFEEAREQETSGPAGSPSREEYVERQRRLLGLPANKTVVSNFNQMYKVNPETFKLWADIVREEETSLFWQILEGPQGERISRRYELHASAHRIAAEKLFWTYKTEIVEFIRRCGLSDIVLDTFPVNAHTVAMDVLWMGTPLLSRPGMLFASRVASSILSSLGQTQLIARNEEDFVELSTSQISNRIFQITNNQGFPSVRLGDGGHRSISNSASSGPGLRSVLRLILTCWGLMFPSREGLLDGLGSSCFGLVSGVGFRSGLNAVSLLEAVGESFTLGAAGHAMGPEAGNTCGSTTHFALGIFLTILTFFS